MLDEQVKRANAEEPWKELALGFMTPEMDMRVRLNAAREEGMTQGLAEGEARGESQANDRFQALITKFTSEGRLTELESVANDPDALNTLMVENGL